MNLRPLRWSDWAFARRLAADATTRAMSHDPRPPSLRGHLGWMRARIASQSAWVASDGTSVRVGIGQVKRARDGRLWIGVTVAPEYRGFGIGTLLIVAVTRRILAQWPNETAVYASIKRENAASQRAFMNAGYRLCALTSPPTSDSFIYQRGQP